MRNEDQQLSLPVILSRHVMLILIYMSLLLFNTLLKGQDLDKIIPVGFPDSPQENTAFGWSVAISNEYAVIGARQYNLRRGAAYVYSLKEGTITRLNTNDVLQTDDYFGNSVAIDGHTIVVGAHESRHGGSVNTGAAYVFELENGNWNQKTILLANDGANLDRFGISVGINSNTIVVGAYFDDDNGTSSGSAYVYERVNETYIQRAKLKGHDAASGDHFGYSVAIIDGIIVVGAPDKDNSTGKVYVFQKPLSGPWIDTNTPSATLMADQHERDFFGQSLDIDGNTVIVGCHGYHGAEEGGAAFIFEYDGENWLRKSTLMPTKPIPLDIWSKDAVSISGDYVVVGDYYWDEDGISNRGAAFVFKKPDVGWDNLGVIRREDLKITDENAAASDYFGRMVGNFGDKIIVGVPYYNSTVGNIGKAFIYELLCDPDGLTATNGLNGKVVLEWNDNSAIENGYKIYRNDIQLGGLYPAGTDNAPDETGIPGELYKYSVVANHSKWGESESTEAYGWSLADGQISGQIASQPPNPDGIPGVKVTARCDELCGSIQFDGINNYVEIAYNPSLNPNNKVTIEAWVKPQLGTQVWSKIFSSGIDNKLELMALNDNQRRFCFYPSINGSFRQVIDTEDWIPDIWYHVAGTYDGQFVRLFVNGILKDSISYQGTLSPYESDPKIGWRSVPNMEHFKGSIDEVRFWNTAHSSKSIKEDMHRILRGDENGLVAYWRFDEREGNIIGDYAENPGTNPEPGLHGIKYGGNWSLDDFAPIAYMSLTDDTGDYNIEKIYYGENGAEFIVTPDTTGNRIFDEEFKTAELKDSNPVKINFTDLSSFSINGYVKFSGMDYYYPDVQISLDEQSVAKTVTDSNGAFTVAVQSGTHKIFPVYYEHSFLPADTTIFVNSTVAGIIFEDTTYYTLSGVVNGGQAGFDIGEATLLINGPDNCFTRTIKTSQGHFQERLPALPGISVTITKIDDETVDLFLENHGGTLKTFKTISLIEGDSTLDFIYYAEPQIIIEGFPDPTTVYNVPVLEQFVTQSINLQIIEDYGQGRICSADSGTFTIFNDIEGESTPSEITIDTLQFYNHIFRTGMPNVVPWGDHPYQKRLQVYVNTKGGSTEKNQWVIVIGYRPREQRFTTVSPEIPLLILHDPPGDASYSFFQEQTTISINFGLSLQLDNSLRTYGNMRVGGGCSVYAGSPFLFTKVLEIDSYASIGASFEVGTSFKSQFEQQFTFTNTEYYATSGDELGTGAPADVFVGAAFNLIYALADVLEINELGEVELSKSIVYGANEDEGMFKTTYIYTQHYITNLLIPELREIINLSTSPDTVKYYEDQIEVWEQTLALNDSLKQNAIDVDDFPNSISFSGLTEYQGTSEVTLQKSLSLDFNLYIDSEIAVEAGLSISGPGGSTGFTAGVQVRSRFTIGSSFTTSSTSTNTVGFKLYDNDPIDKFWVKIKGDPMYGTPVFQIQPGCHTSYPWEPETTPHDGLKLDIDHYVLNGIDPEEQGVYILTLYNTSPTGQTRDYKLVDIPVSNPDGAIIKINGNSFKDLFPYTIPPDQSRTVTMTVDNGPLAYDYEDLQIALCSLEDSQIADTVTFSVHFTPPCSPITLDQPEDGWIANKQLNDSLHVVLRDYDKSKMTSVILQYSPENRNEWKEVFGVSVASLPSNNAELILSTKDLKEGSYDIRAKVTWDQVQGATYSQKSSGIIDRIAPKIFGDPQPADGVLHPGDNISIKFNENIDKNAISAQNVTLQDAHNGAVIPIDVITDDREVIIMPKVSDKEIENKNLQVSLINICDQYGNSSGESIIWSFYVNKNPVFWNTSKISKTILEGETCKFWAKLSNNGGEDVNFNLSNISWLSADPQDGLINKGEEKIVNFTVNSNIMSGYYLDTLFAGLPKGDEPLIIDLHIQNRPPQWTFDPTSFKYNMTITTGFYIDNTPFSEENDLVAAFIGNSICGKVKVQKVAPQDEYIAFLMVHSNYNRPDNVNLVLWDASEGQERTIAEQLTFVADTSYGKASSPDSLHIAGAFLQSIALAENWTWFSLGVEAKDMSVPAVLDGLRPRSGDLVKGHIAYTQYLPGTGWVGSLDTLRIGNGFKIKLSASRELDFIGDPVLDIHWPIEIIPGWNWIGYLPDETMDINYSLASLNPTAADGDQIKNKNSFAGYNSIHSHWEGTLTHMKVGEGYQIKVANNGILRYPGPSGKKISLTKILSAKSINSSAPDWSLDASDFEYTMNVTSTLSIDGLPVSNANTLIGAFINNVCCGVCKSVFVNDKWMYFSTIFSNNTSSDSIQFRVYDAENDQLRDVATKIEFVSDKVLGTPAVPLGLWIGIPTGIEEDMEIPKHFALEHNYPNPFNPKTTIRYALKQPEHVHLIVYDMLGKKVKDLVDMPQIAGWYEVDFNARNLASGVYFYKLVAGPFTRIRKMILIK